MTVEEIIRRAEEKFKNGGMHISIMIGQTHGCS